MAFASLEPDYQRTKDKCLVMLTMCISAIIGSLMSTSLVERCPLSQSSSAERLLSYAHNHRCAAHSFFESLARITLTAERAAGLLKNYDAHASHLRRLLLKATTIMPETAVGYVLENVRNEYGNGDPNRRHQLQLRDLALASGVTEELWTTTPIQAGVRRYIRDVSSFYYPFKTDLPPHFCRPAISAGAITATEVMAIAEFSVMQQAFTQLSLHHHIWFDHVTTEAEHTHESLALALHFVDAFDAATSVMYGLEAVLNLNCHLYDGFCAAIGLSPDTIKADH